MNVYETGVHVFIYCHTRSKQLGPEYRCLSSIVDWWVGTVVFLRSFDLWYIEEIKFYYEGSFDVDYQWFSNLWNAFWLEYVWETSISIFHEKKNKAFTLTNGGKASFFTVTVISCHIIIGTKRTEKISLLVELKRMLHPCVFLVKNCMMLYQSTVTLCLVFNQVSRSFLVLVWPIIR